MRTIRITEYGGPEVLQVVDDEPEPQAASGGVVLDVPHAGLNYADTHQAENSYLAPASVPMVSGAEAVGTTADGRRIVALLGSGGYAQKAAIEDANGGKVDVVLEMVGGTTTDHSLAALAPFGAWCSSAWRRARRLHRSTWAG